MKSHNGNVLLKPSDLRIKHQCSDCQAWLTAHAVPWGQPVALLVTGYCGHCGATYLSFRGTEGDASPAALQLVSALLQGFPGVNVNENGQLTRT